MIPRLELKHLIVLSTLSETGSVTATAQRLGLSQSAVSHRIREAERRLDIDLLRRSGPSVSLTEGAARLSALADRLLPEIYYAEQEIIAEASDRPIIVRFGQTTFNRFHWLPAFLDAFAKVAPHIQTDISSQATHMPFAALRDGTADVVSLYGRRMDTPHFRWRQLGHDPLVAIMPPSHPLAEKEWVDSQDLASEHFFSYPLTNEPGFTWEAVIGAPSTPFRRVSAVQLPEAVIDLVRAGFGISVFSRWAIEPELRDGSLVARPINQEGTSLDWWTVTRADEAPDSPASLFAENLVSWSESTRRGMATLAFEGQEADQEEET